MTVIPFTEASLNQLRELWSTAVVQCLRGSTGDASWSAERPPAETAAPEAGEVATLEFASGADSVAHLDLGWTAEGAEVWRQLLKAATLEAMVERLAAAAGESMRAEWGAPWGERPARIVTVVPADAEIHHLPLHFANGGGQRLEILLGAHADLCEQLHAVHAPVNEAVRLDLLRDVEVDVSLRFGGRQVQLGEVLDLSTGSVIELDRSIDGPVELLVGGKVIAWGEVVLVEGNYGLRISRLLQPADRMAAMGGAR